MEGAINILKKSRDVCAYYTLRDECNKCPLDNCNIIDLNMDDESIVNLVIKISNEKLDDKWISLHRFLSIINFGYTTRNQMLYVYDHLNKARVYKYSIDIETASHIIESLKTYYDHALYDDMVQQYFNGKDDFHGMYEDLYNAVKDRPDVNFIEKKYLECMIYPEKIYIPELKESQ